MSLATNVDMWLGTVPLGDTLYALFTSVNTSDVPTDADSAPTIDWYDYDLSDPSLLYNDRATSKFASLDGTYRLDVPATDAAGFAKGKTYWGVASWEISSSARKRTFGFQVV